MENNSQEPDERSAELPRQRASNNSFGTEISFEEASSQYVQCLNTPVQTCEVVEFEGEDAANKWKDALDQRDFAESVMNAFDCLVMKTTNEENSPEISDAENSV